MARMTKSSVEIQEVFLNFMLSNTSLFTRVQNIYNVENFDCSLRNAAKFLYDHVKDHNSIPTTQQINAVTNTKLELIDGITEGHESWFLEEFEQFTRIEEMNRAILKSVDLLEKGDFGPIEKLIKDAVQISLTRDLGINYFENPRVRLMKLKESNGQVSTGWRDIDYAIFGGFNRGELEIFCGLPAAGKSLILQNLALNWILTGLNGVYITLELSPELIAMRLDSMITGITSKEIFKRLEDVELQVVMTGKKAGRLRIKYLPTGSTVNDIKAYIKELAIKENFKPDFICVDYMDLVNPGAYKVDQSDFFTKDKLVSEELRNYAIELRTIMVTAAQINRSGDGEVEFSYSNIQTIKKSSPAFFEKLVVDLLLKMGYGGTRKDAGQTVGRSGDGGIDGIINEDRLGLDVIYIQAKRWENSVGRPEIQKFAGTLQGFRAKKGIFITSSTFTKEARDFVSRIDSRIILIFSS